MQAVVLTETGAPDVLRYREWPDPEPGPADVRVRIKAAGINHRDLFLRAGAFGMPSTPVIGSDAAGIVEAIGAGVDGVCVGDAVIVNPSMGCGRCAACQAGDHPACASFRIYDGTYAQYAVLPATNVVPKPPSLSFEQASVIGLVGNTAYDMVVERAKLRPGETALVWGANGGLGTMLVQLAHIAGARVVAVGSDADYLSGLGADLVLDRRKADVAQQLEQQKLLGEIDVVFDSVGAPTFATSLQVVRRGGRVVTVGATGGGEVTLQLGSLFRRRVALLGAYMGSMSALHRLLPLLQEGRLTVPISEVLPLQHAAQAHRLMDQGGLRGKLVLVP